MTQEWGNLRPGSSGWWLHSLPSPDALSPACGLYTQKLLFAKCFLHSPELPTLVYTGGSLEHLFIQERPRRWPTQAPGHSLCPAPGSRWPAQAGLSAQAALCVPTNSNTQRTQARQLQRPPQGDCRADRVRNWLGDHRGRGESPGKDCSSSGASRGLPRQGRRRGAWKLRSS